MDCIFCKLIEGKIPSNKAYEDEKVYAFHDIHPLAKGHVLFVHREHSSNVNSMEPPHIAEVFEGIRKFTQGTEWEKQGFRVVTNLGPYAGQTVFHTHFHVLGLEKLGGFGK